MNKRIWLLVFGMALLLAGCSNLAAPTATLEASATEAIPTAIPPTITPTLTLTSTLTITPTFTSTWTPIPTLSPLETSQKIKEFMQTNGDCQLPCWWGVDPGKTTWQEAKQLLYPIAHDVYEANLLKNPESAYVETFFELSENQSINEDFLVLDTIIQEIEIRPHGFDQQFQQKKLLEEIGIPDEIFINLIRDRMDSFRIVLYYQQRGIFALYSSKLMWPSSDQTRSLCMKDIDYMQLDLWSPNEYSFDRTRDWIFDQYGGEFFPIAEVSDLTSKGYYERLLQSGDAATCIDVPVQYWKQY